MRMKSSTHHAVAILTLRELKHHRRRVRASRAVQYRDSRCESNEVPPPAGATVEFHSYRHPDSLTRGSAFGGIAHRLWKATAAGPSLP